MLKLITVIDATGKEHSFYAAKPISAHPGDSHLLIVIQDSYFSYHLFVVHTFNTATGDFVDGLYFTTFDEALGVFGLK